MAATDDLRAPTRWAACGGMWLTGAADGAPLVAPAAIAPVLDEWAERLRQWVSVDGAALLGERAAIAGFTRQGSTSCGGATRLLEATDGWLALTLARTSDIDALTALFGESVTGLDWERVARLVRARRAADLRDQAVLLEIPVGVLGERSDVGPLVERDAIGEHPSKAPDDLLVVDLSAMWAGPLCGQLLTQSGASVVKVESPHRIDGARNGPTAFFDLLHAGQRSVAPDLTTHAGREVLRSLLHRADVVIEGSRPRALAELGVAYDVMRADGWRGVWVSITAHGGDETNAGRVGFGDDAAVAGGLVAWHAGRPVFCADAVADPATGLLAASEVLCALRDGWSGRLSLSLARTAAHLAARVAAAPIDPAIVDTLRAAPPHARAAGGVAPLLGMHDDEVLVS